MKIEIDIAENQELLPGAPINNAESVLPYVGHIRTMAKEVFVVLHLNQKLRVMNVEYVSVGTAMSTHVHPRHVFRSAVEKGAVTILLVHNHPSGDPAPSASDIKITNQLVEAGRILGIAVIDHVIVGSKVLSLREAGLVSFDSTCASAMEVQA